MFNYLNTLKDSQNLNGVFTRKSMPKGGGEPPFYIPQSSNRRIELNS